MRETIFGILLLVTSVASYRISPACITCLASADCQRFGADMCLDHTCYKSSDTSKCQYTPNLSNTQCNDSTVCVDKSKCLHGWCTCDPGYRFNPQSESCVKYAIGDPCLYSYDCGASLGDSAICNDGFCTCRDKEHTYFMGGCFKPVGLNSPCLHDEECLMKNNNSQCRVWCVCETGYQVHNMRCQAFSTNGYPIVPRSEKLESTENAIMVVAIGSVVLIIIFTALKCLRKYRRAPILLYESDKPESSVPMTPQDRSTLLEPPPSALEGDLPPSYDEVTSPSYKLTVPERNQSHRTYHH